MGEFHKWDDKNTLKQGTNSRAGQILLQNVGYKSIILLIWGQKGLNANTETCLMCALTLIDFKFIDIAFIGIQSL